eukprot:CAMPEP_0180563758 /NCGR_PEP_ID=MMETSP1037_2-20121125/4649_1 /TAXON_ID=632150 /ORGANISM="Azadinium spinosum, Strain 3D9" /LENGTH=45 /DNA_ID= /DNA_START= /DNA_END= /DNA_ORIENTATION=
MTQRQVIVIDAKRVFQLHRDEVEGKHPKHRYEGDDKNQHLVGDDY